MKDFEKLSGVLVGCVSVPVHGDASPFILPSFTEVVVTPLQDGVLQCLSALEKEVRFCSFHFFFSKLYTRNFFMFRSYKIFRCIFSCYFKTNASRLFQLFDLSTPIFQYNCLSLLSTKKSLLIQL